jgi:hypothetical protein
MQYNVYCTGLEMYFLHRVQRCLMPDNVGNLMPFVLAGHKVPAQLSINLARNHLQAIAVHLLKPFSSTLSTQLAAIHWCRQIFRRRNLGNC